MSSLKKTLNEAQKKAVQSLTQDTFISAGAGTGKTTVLVTRFIEIIKKGTPLSRILAVTFTEKAAMEMRERLYQAFQTLSQTEPEKYLNYLYQFDTAQITTIHGFCSQLLKENAIEAGIDPKFRVLEDIESDFLKEEIIQSIFNEKILTEDSARKEKWLNFFETFDPQKIKSAVFKIHRQLQSLGKSAQHIELPPPLPIEKLKDQLETIAGEYQKAAAAFQNNDGVKKRLSAMAEVLSADLDDLEKIDLPGRGVAGSVELKEIYAPFVDAFEHLIKMAYEIKHLPARELFYELLSNFEKTFYFEKRSQGLLDFDDLQVKTLELLTSQKIKTNLFDYLMIDETQDTSAIQFQIFNKLKNKNNLFFVGDHKQSIYGFRYAEPEQFLALSQKTDFVRIDLQENYRSHKPVIDFVNEVFTLFWEKNHGYEPLQQGLVQDAESHSPEIVILSEKEKTKISTLRKKEAFWVGQKILERLAAGVPEKEIVILLRSLTHAALFENVLKNLNIRYQLIKGKGFFDQLEIRDLLSVLKLLQNPTAELELLSILRSPFFGISDQKLYELKKKSPRSRLLETAYQMFPAFKKVFEPLYHAQNKMTLAGLLNQFIQNTSYEAVSFGKFQGLRRLSNIRKLLEAVAVFEQNHGRNLTALAQYLDHLQKKDLRENTPDVPESDEADLDQGSVKIMTIHAAKGLEFNTVFYSAIDSNPGGGGKGTPGPAFLYDGDKTMSIKGGYFEIFIKEQQTAKELAEAKRIFYVASTRAKEKLYLTGGFNPQTSKKSKTSKTTEDEKEGKNVLSWLMELYPEVKNLIEAGEPGHFHLKHFSLLLPEAGSLGGLPRQKQINLNEKLDATPLSEEIKLWSAPILQLSSQTLSATEYTLLPYCARAFQLKVRYGAESFSTPMEDDFEPDEERLQSSDEYLGRRVHEFIKNISSTDPVLKIKQKMGEEVLTFKTESDQKLFKKCLEVFLSSVYAVWISHKNTLWREKKFMVSLDRHLLQGIIDYAYLDNDNQWVVIDFKTSVIHSPAHRQWLRAHYFGQLQAYSYALEKLTPYPVKEAKLVFLSDHHCEEVFSREELQLETLTGQSLEKGFVDQPEKNLKHCEFCYLKGFCKP